jgi:ankyrin repeat protein
LAVKCELLEVVKLLLEHGADPNYKNDGRTLLHIATRDNLKSIVQLLLEYGVDPSVKHPNGLTAKDIAKILTMNDEIFELIESYEFDMIKEPEI